MRSYIILLLNVCELTAVIAGCLHWKKIRNTYWKWFLFYLITILLVELTGKYLNIVANNPKLNLLIYTFFGIPLQFFFFFWLFRRQAGNKGNHLFLIAAVIYAVSWVVEFMFLRGGRLWFMSFSYTVGNTLLAILIINYLINFIQSEDILNFKQHMMFWVAVGLAIFYIGTLPFFALRNTLLYNYRNIFIVYDYIQLVLDCLMYIVFALSFIWGKPK